MARDGKKNRPPNRRGGRLLGVNVASALDFAEQEGRRRPPSMSFNPALEAERRSLQRGLEDLFADTRRDLGRGRRDFRTTRKDLKRTKRRGMQDIRRDSARGERDFATQLERGGQDFASQLASLIHGTSVQAQQHAEAANAAGVIGGSTTAAAAAARAGAMQRARQPLDQSFARLGEDVATGRTQLGQDTARARQRLGQDVRGDMRLARRDFRRFRGGLRTELQRGIREQRIGDIDLTQQSIYDARQQNPGAFSRRGRRTGPLRGGNR